jgi:hypothetical protein
MENSGLEAVLVKHVIKADYHKIEINTETLSEFSEEFSCGQDTKILAIKNLQGETNLLLTNMPTAKIVLHDSSAETKLKELIKNSKQIKCNYSQFDVVYGIKNLNVCKYILYPKELPANYALADKQKINLPHLGKEYLNLDLSDEVAGKLVYVDPNLDNSLYSDGIKRALIDLCGEWTSVRGPIPIHIKPQEGALFSRPKAPITFMALGTSSGLVDMPNTCFALELDNGSRYYIDFPRNMYAAGDLSKVQNVILTHNDPDHEGDLVRLLQEKAFNRKEKVNILTARPIFTEFKNKILQEAVVKSANFIDICPGKIHKLSDGLTIETRWNTHGVPTLGLKLKYNGKKLGYSSDTKYLGEAVTEEILSFIDRIPLEKNRPKHRNLLFFAYVARELESILEKHGCTAKNSLLYTEVSQVLDEIDYHPLVKDIVPGIKEYFKHKFSMAWLADCDMILHEATNNSNDPVHTYVGELENLPEEIRNKMYIVHTPNNFNCPKGLKMLRPMRKYQLV